MSKKQNKIKVCISYDRGTRQRMLSQLAIQAGFARIPSDALKIMQPELYSINPHEAYFILTDDYNFRGNSILNQKLFELAARGLFVAVGVRALPREYQFLCEAYYQEDLI